MAIIEVEPDIVFESQEAQSILDAALDAGLFFPYSCKTGRCNSCMCQVRSGETRLLHEEQALTDEQRRAGWILGCARTAQGTLRLGCVDVFPFQLPSPKTLPCRINAIEWFSPDLVRVVLRLPPGQELSYLAGQYIDVIKDGVSRSYSIANAPRSDRTIELHIKRFEAGVLSSYWFGHAQKNDLLRLRGPLGTFFLRNLVDRDVIFLSTGTGYAPVKAMLEQLQSSFNELKPRSVTIYRGARMETDLYSDAPALGIPVRYVPVLSRPGSAWTGARGYVQDICLAAKPDLSNTVFYACGSDQMIADAKNKLVTAGLEPGQFFSDAFVRSGSSL